MKSLCRSLASLDHLTFNWPTKKKCLARRQPWNVSQSLATLSDSAFTFFTNHFFAIGPGKGINTKLASEIAIALTNAIMQPIAAQIDPLLLGRVERSMKIAHAYSERVNPSFKNIKRLIEGYPSHEFVIDFDEAKKLFPNVREPDGDEQAIEEGLRLRQWAPREASKDTITVLLPTEKPLPESANENESNNGNESTGQESDNEPHVVARARTSK